MYTLLPAPLPLDTNQWGHHSGSKPAVQLEYIFFAFQQTRSNESLKLCLTSDLGLKGLFMLSDPGQSPEGQAQMMA